MTHHLKPTAFKVPLSIHSSHAPGVHISWPYAMAWRTASLNSSDANTTVALTALKNRLLGSYASPQIIKAIDYVAANFRHKLVKHVRYGTRPVKWLVLPYHPAVFDVAKRKLRDILQQTQSVLKVAFGNGYPTIRIAWSNNIPHLIRQVTHVRMQ